jgi:hypothetical protein
VGSAVGQAYIKAKEIAEWTEIERTLTFGITLNFQLRTEERKFCGWSNCTYVTNKAHPRVAAIFNDLILLTKKYRNQRKVKELIRISMESSLTPIPGKSMTELVTPLEDGKKEILRFQQKTDEDAKFLQVCFVLFCYILGGWFSRSSR